ncbi:MAG: aspartate aminotransferase [Armatimonadetes bacterium CG2_30_59_28]|nr:pyridoxal phosphate-dependent aminotransferase [Armatimonadota bacterium]OIO94910.1 MAG: aspartate aminotransferase [Armatimonadetes bacterium CG2_30_59_28]PIU60754.1 MAG: aspartate aminotransferase [Armatimonadetes bacterium CG07_land_8_20_14_0_80_59_28]PIX43936.1 MAG: aspartate aminotransferase [Armatimonadetes bacterium CG_4_8_14_3_um_filter_58_9]PIY38026.1 MAG: aspartate aminotransferase [Armatimonadetes bacterium CG_4_10_14_3_um_filter_59_10]PJB62649.1 MAG: aspartate aminotransferase [
MQTSSRANRIQPSPTLAVTAKAKQMKAEGIDVVSFGAGEPDFDTPDHIKMAAIKALASGDTKYTPSSGTLQLRKAVCRKLQEENGLEYEPAQIIVSCGAKHSLYNIFQAMLNPGDEVVIPAPYWVSYPDQVLLADGKPVIISAGDSSKFKISPQQLREAMTDNTVAVVINSPSNPTGATYSPDALRELAEVILEHPTAVAISDEIYEKIVYDGREVVSIASVLPEMKERTVVVNGLSKCASMTGWRMGYAASVKSLAAAMDKIQSQSTSNPTSFIQPACIVALEQSRDFVNMMVEAFDQRRRRITELLNDIPGLTMDLPEGAFYAFANASGVMGKTFNGVTVNNSGELSGYLLDHAKVAVVPGNGFGLDTHIRLSYATSMENIEEGLRRIKEALAYNASHSSHTHCAVRRWGGWKNG